MNIYADLLKVEKTINSCKTEDQLKNACYFANNFLKFYKEVIKGLEIEMYVHKLIFDTKNKAMLKIFSER